MLIYFISSLNIEVFEYKMKSSKVIDVSKASIVSLKAELLRKQEEVSKRTQGATHCIRPLPRQKVSLKTNAGVEERRLKDEVSQEEVDLLKKSREVLEVKSKLYEKLQTGHSVQENVGDPYLVDFKEKLDKVFQETRVASSLDEEEKVKPLEDSDSEDDDWVDYVDCFGRTRRCLKEDFKAMRDRDDEMQKMLGHETAPEDTEPTVQQELSEHQLEMMSSDMQREKMREKWEQKEQLLLNKKNIYYEDVRFDEARSHGVAYYSFSTDESKREEEQAEFKRVRQETEAKQREAQEAKNRRDAMKQSRLIAARQRQRARLGLPFLSTNIEDSSSIVSDKEGTPAEDHLTDESNVKDLEAALTRAAHVRPWDIGKDGVKQPDKIMSQEEWVEKKRDERPQEFAPPQEKQINTFKSSKKRKHKKQDTDLLNEDPPNPWPQTNLNFKPDLCELKLKTGPPKTGVTVPPPASFEYYTPSKRAHYQPSNSNQSSKDMKDSIEAGLEFLRHQAEKRDKLVEKNKFFDG